MQTPLHFLEDSSRHERWHISNETGPICGAETNGTGWHLPDDDFVKVNLCMACWEIVADPQRAEVERLRAILQNISDKITDNNLDFAGPSGIIHVPLSREEIDAIRAAAATPGAMRK